IFFMLNWIGGGDVKLMTGAALWAGPQDTVILLLVMSLLGFLIAIALMSLRTYGVLVERLVPDNPVLRRLQFLAQQGQCPYGVAIGAAALVAVHPAFLQ